MTTSGLTLVEAISVLQMALVFVGALVVILWLLPGDCKCEKCAFHTNARRMAKARQKELQHDTEHKGFGFKPNAEDRFFCNDEACPRNPKR